ncbi:MAG TPA: stalk domain-containing protein [Symbiobacteriaceae bacterium]
MAPAGAAEPAVTSREWSLIETAQAAEAGGDVTGTVSAWSTLVTLLKTHNYDACGNYAQKLGRALDKQGLYLEAVAAFADEFYCWGQFPDRQEWVLGDQRRAEQIRPEIQLFVARPTADEPHGVLAKNEPAFGTLLGATIDKDPAVAGDLSRVPAVYGKPYALVLDYAEWGSYPIVTTTRAAKAAGAALQVAWNPSEGLDAVQDNSYVRNFAQQLQAYGLPVYLRFGGEMNGSWVAWYGDPAKFRAKFALIARIMRQEAPNVAMVWSPNYVGDGPMDDYFPGDEWVDWVGINLYHESYFLGDPGTRQLDADIFYQGMRSNPLDKVKAIYGRYAARKPIMISETGFGWATRKTYKEEIPWAVGALERFYGYAPLLYPRLKAVSYFNVDVMSNPGVPTSSHYVLSGKPAMTQAYRQATAGAWYLGSPTATAPKLWRPAEKASLVGPNHVAAYVNLGGGVSRVEYYVDQELAAQSTRLPWEADIDRSSLQGEHTVTVKAYDQKGTLGYQRSYTFDASAIRVNLNGRYLDFDQPPVLLNGRVLVPARAILEALGAEITWEAATQTVVAKRDGSTLRLQIGNPVPTKDGSALKSLDVPAQIIGGRTLVPARFVAENYRMDVKWDQATRTVTIAPLP